MRVRPMGMRGVLGAALAALVACGGVGRTDGRPPAQAEPSTKQRYEARGLVLESEEHGPMLCLGMLLDSLPPQCGDVPLTNWDWDGVPGERRRSGTTWGEYRVVGTYDGQSFTVQEAAVPHGSAPFDDGDPIDTPCEEPAGGWVAEDPSRVSEADRQRASQAAAGKPDFAGLWIDYIGNPKPEEMETDPTSAEIILNVAFTGDLERNTADLRALWGGPLCVVQHRHTEHELRSIQHDFPGGDSDLGLDVLWSDIDIVDNVVEIGVVAIDVEGRAAVDERYGPGVVRIVPALQPVD
jgi:hypothetical protein